MLQWETSGEVFHTKKQQMALFWWEGMTNTNPEPAPLIKNTKKLSNIKQKKQLKPNVCQLQRSHNIKHGCT